VRKCCGGLCRHASEDARADLSRARLLGARPVLGTWFRQRRLPLLVAVAASVLTFCYFSWHSWCLEYYNPVRPLHIDFDTLHAIVLYPDGPETWRLAIDDPSVVRACAHEVNRLACSAHWGIRKPIGPPFQFVDQDGSVLATLWLAPGPSFIIRPPDGRPYQIRYEELPTVGRLLTYWELRHVRAWLESALGAPEDQAWHEEVQLGVELLNGLSPEFSFTPPEDRAGLRELLRGLDSISLQDLPMFNDWMSETVASDHQKERPEG